MVKNYITSILRSLIKNKTYTLINLFGLALGISCCLTIFLIIKVELSFDTFHNDVQRIYRLVTEQPSSSGTVYNTGTHFPTAESLKLDFPELDYVVPTKYEQYVLITISQPSSGTLVGKFKEKHGVGFTESQFFELFDFSLIRGDVQNCLNRPNTAVISKQTAFKYFGHLDPIGQIIRVDNRQDVVITGVFEDFPDNTDFPFNKLIISWSSYQGYNNMIDTKSWDSVMGSAQTYVKMPVGMSAKYFESQLESFASKYIPDHEKNGLKYVLQPLTEIHFDERYGNYLSESVSYQTLQSIALIGLFLIITAIINFVNLSTAQAITRSKEVGIRKVLGTSRWQLIIQFMLETAIMTIAAMILGLGLTEMILLFFTDQIQFIGTPVLAFTWEIQLFLIIITIFTSALAGIYPAIIVSGFSPLTALKNSLFNKKPKGLGLRRSLVIVQFAIAQTLIFSTLIIVNQIQHFHNKDLGFNKEAIIEFSIPNNDSTNLALLRHNLIKHSNITNASFSLSTAINDSPTKSEITYDKLSDAPITVELKLGDENFIASYGIQLLAGRTNRRNDGLKSIVVNETLLKKLHINDPHEALGENINFLGMQSKIIGVVRDFHMSSLKQQITPCIISSYSPLYFAGNVNIKLVDLQETMEHVRREWLAIYPEHVFDYQFLDDKIAGLYQNEIRTSQLFVIFSSIAIFISCIGLYGLVTFIAAQKTKEVGVRKVLGANVFSIISLFSKEFMYLTFLGMLISSPFAYFIMSKWLEEFAYRIEIRPMLFVLVGLITLIIAGLTVGYKSYKTAIANPVKALRNE